MTFERKLICSTPGHFARASNNGKCDACNYAERQRQLDEKASSEDE